MSEKSEHGQKETARIESFSDGVFAIAITLLILELIQTLHTFQGEPLQKLIFSHWESYVAFAIGFITILVCWINHHMLFSFIIKTESTLMWVNGFVLLVVSFTPFPTAVLAEYFSTESNIALALFGFNYIMMSVASYWLTAYVFNRKLISEEGRKYFPGFKKIYLFSILYTIVCFFICFVSIPVAVFLYCILFMFFAFPKEGSIFLFKNKFEK